MTPLIEIQDLQVVRAGKRVLQVDQLAIEAGETLAIVGPNGAGKSTLLLVLAHLLRPDSGNITFGGRPLSAIAATDYRRRIALVMQQPLLFDATVYANVATGLRFRGLAAHEIEERVPPWLARLGVAHLSSRSASEISGGEARRVSLARALVLEPDLLLLDEPFSALDPPTHQGILDDFGAQLQAIWTTTVLVTHDLQEARRLADRVAVLIDGRLQWSGNKSALAALPMDDPVRAFLHPIGTDRDSRR